MDTKLKFGCQEKILRKVLKGSPFMIEEAPKWLCRKRIEKT